MTGREAYKIWAPAGTRWAAWVRPVPFAAMEDVRAHAANEAAGPVLPGVAYVVAAREDMAVVVDLPGADGVWEGVALAGLGFLPVPLYNGTNAQAGAMAQVENRPLENALRLGAVALDKLALPPNAPPAFLLDSDRTHRHRMDASVFDNSWDIYDQDMPSADCLLACGIRGIIVRGGAIQRDLARILYKYQKKGLAILHTGGYGRPKAHRLKKPPRKAT